VKTLRIASLPDGPLDAASRFEDQWLPEARTCDENLLLVFAPADHAHRKWRLAVVQELAREAAPRRVNAVASGDEEAIGQAEGYLADAPGITGQYLRLAK
jgi:hypothetical protein